MKIIHKIELIGDGNLATCRMYARVFDMCLPAIKPFFSVPARYWIAEITGRCPKYGYARTFLPFKRDYSQSNSKGTRGIQAVYILESGKVYELKEAVSWKNSDRYFARVTEQGTLARISKEEVDAWLTK